MTQLRKSDIVSYITFLKLNYGEKAYNYTEKDLDKIVEYWYRQLKEFPKEIVGKSIQNCINKNEYPPTIASILKEIENMKESIEKSGIDLWEELENVFYDVSNNASKYYYSNGNEAIERNREIYNKLSPEIRAYVKNCGQLVALATAENKTKEIEKGRFLNSLPEIKKRIQYQEMLPSEYKQILNKTAKTLSWEKGDKK